MSLHPKLFLPVASPKDKISILRGFWDLYLWLIAIRKAKSKGQKD